MFKFIIFNFNQKNMFISNENYPITYEIRLHFQAKQSPHQATRHS